MNSTSIATRSRGPWPWPWRRTVRRVLLTIPVALAASGGADAAPQVVVWDTGARLGGGEAAENAGRTGWKAVPTELFAFEADPAKAASDPGYYGREHSFKGDAVVENPSLTAVFWSARGRVVIYSKGDATVTGGAGPATGALGRKVFEWVPLVSDAVAERISRCEIVRNAGDEVVVDVAFTAKGSPDRSAVFSFGRNAVVEIKPGEGLKAVRLFCPIEYAIVPGFVGDDLIVGPDDIASANPLALPVENVLVGLIQGEDGELVMSWPKGGQRLQLQPAGGSAGRRVVEFVEFEPGGQSFYVAALSAKGLWHREQLKPAFLEKDVALSWERPFPARWKTQLNEAGVLTTFAFREAKGTVWRGVPGSYDYPVWFDGARPLYHLSKKVPPKGESIVYFLEPQDTPASVMTPVDFMKATLGRAACEPLLDVAGRKLRTHHRRGGDGVHRACTCGCTEAIQSYFEAGLEVAKQNDIQEALGDMNYFVERHLERIDEYRKFASDLAKEIQARQAASPGLKDYLAGLEAMVQQIPHEYEVQQENMKSLDHAGELTQRTMALTRQTSTNNVTAYMDLLKAWRAMGGAQDYVVAQCHLIARKQFQEAGRGCLENPTAVPAALAIRARCRQVLRNPDGYEIWADY